MQATSSVEACTRAMAEAPRAMTEAVVARKTRWLRNMGRYLGEDAEAWLRARLDDPKTPEYAHLWNDAAWPTREARIKANFDREQAGILDDMKDCREFIGFCRKLPARPEVREWIIENTLWIEQSQENMTRCLIRRKAALKN